MRIKLLHNYLLVVRLLVSNIAVTNTIMTLLESLAYSVICNKNYGFKQLKCFTRGIKFVCVAMCSLVMSLADVTSLQYIEWQ